MFKRLLSYFTPVVEKKVSSKINNQLQLVWRKGNLSLDTKHTTYSYGKLQNILKQGLAYIGFEKIRKCQKVLILGLGAGGVLELLREHIHYANYIDSVELDPLMLELGKTYFKLNQYQDKHKIHQMDAFEYVLSCKNTYDLIIIDIFQDYHMPGFLFADYFQAPLLKLLNQDGFILFNTIAIDKKAITRNQNYQLLFDHDKYSFRKYPRSLDGNELFTIKKL